ncbi:MAG TPA: arginase family protein [Granulicella sp.]
MHRRLTLLDAPSNLGLKPPSPGKEPGVRQMARVLRAHGIVTQLHAEDAGEVTPPNYQAAIDSATKIRNAHAIRDYSAQLASRIGTLLDENRFPLVLGGDCSILLGSTLALRKRGRYGLLFIDGHSDLLTPEISQTGGAAGMDLALATGTGPKLLTEIDAAGPYIQPGDAVVFGYNWPPPDEASPAAPKPPMMAFPLSTVRKQGAAHSAQTAVTHLEGIGRGFWIHLDLDVLAPEWMPAVDSPNPGGMTPEELLTTLKIAVSSKQCVGMEVTIYDPTQDPKEHGADLIVKLLVQAFS